MNEIQELYLQLIERSGYNEFDGRRVARELREHRDLWDAALMTRDDTGLILRDLPEGSNNVAVLYLTTTQDRLRALRQLARKWKADEMEEVEFSDLRPGTVCLQLWWD